MCVLHAGLLEACDDCYDYANGVFQYERLQERVERFGEEYSKELVEVLVAMLQENRMGFGELEGWLVGLMAGQKEMGESEENEMIEEDGMKKSHRTTRESRLMLSHGLKPLGMDAQDAPSGTDSMWTGVDPES